MDYFLSSGANTVTEPLNTIIMQPIDTIAPTMNTSSLLSDIITQFIPSELLSLVNLPLL
jgi:hypothetical protein